MKDAYNHIGVLLAAAREEFHLTIDQASRELHIRARYLEALEEGRFSDLPGLAYTKGYLQAYAGYLHLDKDEILHRFEQMEGVLGGRRGFYFPQVLSREKTPSRQVVTGSLVALFIAYLFWELLLTPSQTQLSVVDQVKPRTVSITAVMARDVPCLRPPDGLYPPCHTARRWVVLPTPYFQKEALLAQVAAQKSRAAAKASGAGALPWRAPQDDETNENNDE